MNIQYQVIYIYIYITQFWDPHHKHIPGNLIIIDNSELQKLMAKGSKIQEVSHF